jgi:hypothetical protein
LRDVLNTVPIWLLLLAAEVLALGVVLLSVWVTRRAVPATRDGFHAEISAPMLSVVAALFGFVLAFVIIIAYENYLSAKNQVGREANSLAAVVRDSDAFRKPEGEQVRRAVGGYVRGVVNDGFPHMRQGDPASPLALHQLAEVYAALRNVKTSSPEELKFYDDAITRLNDALDARRDRLDAAQGGLPADIAALVLFGSFVIVAYAVLVGSPRFWFHVLGPAAIAMVVAFSLVVLADLSYPFSGDLSIDPEAFKSGVLEQFFTGPSSK